MRFSGSRKFDEHELRRLSPAVEYHRALIGVHLEDGRPCVWGFAQSGPRWLQVARGGRAVDVPLPPVIVVRVARPGQVAVACGAQPIAQLHNGRLIDLTLDVFDSSWLPARFAEVRGELTTLHAIANPDAAPVDPQLVQVLAQHMVKRTIATVRASHHGGTILILPVACEAAGADGAHILRMKYDFADEPPRRRYRTLLLAILAQIAKLASNIATKEAGWEEYQTASSAALGELDEALFELSVTIAALAEVDGAVVLDKRFELLGFGAEIGGDLPVVELVARVRCAENHAVHGASARIGEAQSALGQSGHHFLWRSELTRQMHPARGETRLEARAQGRSHGVTAQERDGGEVIQDRCVDVRRAVVFALPAAVIGLRSGDRVSRFSELARRCGAET